MSLPADERPSNAGTGGGRVARRAFPAFAPFFLGAAVLAALAVPLWVLQFAGILPAWLDDPAAWHGHEMVFGFALAVVAGYLIAKASRAAVLGAFALWLANRVVFLMPGIPLAVEAILALAFPVVLFWLAGRPFLKAAKSWRNALFGVVVGAFAVAEAMFQAGALGLLEDGRQRGLLVGVDLIALLLFAMGGRIIAAATSGAIQRKGGYVKGWAQPGLERAGVLALIAMTVLDGVGVAPAIGGVGAAAAAMVVIVRMVRWQAWRVAGVADAALLHLGYAWLAVGLVLRAGALGATPLDATHGILVGGLGILSTVMMARTAQQRLRLPISPPWVVRAAVGLVAVAAACRVLAPLGGPYLELMIAAAVAWTLAFVILAGFLARLLLRGGPGGRGAAGNDATP